MMNNHTDTWMPDKHPDTPLHVPGVIQKDICPYKHTMRNTESLQIYGYMDTHTDTWTCG